MSSRGNNGNNLDLMMSVRHEPAKHEITGEALLHLQRLIDSVSGVTIVQDRTHVSVKDLIMMYKWPPFFCNIVSYLPLFSEVIENDMVKIEDVPKFDSLMYKVMGE